MTQKSYRQTLYVRGIAGRVSVSRGYRRPCVGAALNCPGLLTACSKTAVSNSLRPKTAAPQHSMLILARGSVSHRGRWHWQALGGEVQLTTAGVCTPKGQWVPHAGAVTPRGTATGEKHGRGKTAEALCDWEELLISKEAQRKRASKVQQKRSLRSVGWNLHQMALMGLPTTCWRSWDEAQKLGVGRMGAHLVSSLGQAGKSVWVSFLLFIYPQYPTKLLKVVLTGNKVSKNSPSQGCFACNTLLDKQSSKFTQASVRK